MAREREGEGEGERDLEVLDYLIDQLMYITFYTDIIL